MAIGDALGVAVAAEVAGANVTAGVDTAGNDIIGMDAMGMDAMGIDAMGMDTVALGLALDALGSRDDEGEPLAAGVGGAKDQWDAG